MYEELSADLAKDIQRRFQVIMSRKAQSDDTFKGIIKRIRSDKATQLDISEYADFVGQAGSAAMKQVLKLDALPDQTMYREIAEQTITPTMQDMWGYVNTNASKQLLADDRAKGLTLSIRTGFKPKQRINDVVNMLAGQTTQEAVDNALTDPVIATARKYYDDFLMENADMRETLGFRQQVIRQYDDKGLHNGKTPCQWCLRKEGTWSMEEAHANGVFNRHPGCGCKITVFFPDHTEVQTDWTRNEWSRI